MLWNCRAWAGLFASLSAMDDLATYLMDRLPGGMGYPDAAQLCLRLYCTVDGVPEELCPLDKERLGEAFARLAKAGWVRQEEMWHTSLYGATFHQLTDKGHWIEVMASTFKRRHVVNFERAESLARQVGFVKSKSLS